MSNSETLC